MSEIQNILIEKYGEQMKQTPQSPKFHGEGDVLTHTIMVCDALKLLPEYVELTENQQEILKQHIQNRLKKCLQNYNDVLKVDDAKKMAQEMRKIKKI